MATETLCENSTRVIAGKMGPQNIWGASKQTLEFWLFYEEFV